MSPPVRLDLASPCVRGVARPFESQPPTPSALHPPPRPPWLLDERPELPGSSFCNRDAHAIAQARASALHGEMGFNNSANDPPPSLPARPILCEQTSKASKGRPGPRPDVCEQTSKASEGRPCSRLDGCEQSEQTNKGHRGLCSLCSQRSSGGIEERRRFVEADARAWLSQKARDTPCDRMAG